MNPQNVCISCMKDRGEQSVCPFCGFAENGLPASSLYLAPRSILNRQYLVGKILGHGGFGVTYLALDINLNTRVAIKEYLPRGIARRSAGSNLVHAEPGIKSEHFVYGLEKFLDEARTLAKFNENPGTVTIINFFRDNDTAYLVMEYLDGVTLRDYIKQQGGSISLTAALPLIFTLVDSLQSIHSQGLIHRDISPDNIYVCSNGQVKLLDFGAARYALGEKSQTLSVILKPGFAPVEQYSSKGSQGPWTDIYAAAATIYYALSGQIPPEASGRLKNDSFRISSAGIPPAAARVLTRATAVREQDRQQSAAEFKNDLQQALLISGISLAQIQAPGLLKPPYPGPYIPPAGPSPAALPTTIPEPGANSAAYSPTLAYNPYIQGFPEFIQPAANNAAALMQKYWLQLSVSGLVVLIALLVFLVFELFPSGMQVMEYDNGDQYSGMMSFGSREGMGTLTEAGGAVYTGEWSDDLRNGSGRQQYADGVVYDGLWKNDMRNGQGLWKDSPGHSYNGSWTADKFSGQGTELWPNGDKYVGEYKNGIRNGQGTFYAKDGSIYAGEFANNDFNGQGTFTWSNGDRYEGGFISGLREGQGVKNFASGDRYSGEWKEDLMSGQGVYTWGKGEFEGDKYEGEFQHGKPNGFGTYTFASGARYVGEWKDNKRHGQGTYYAADGTVKSGTWVNDEFKG